MKTSEQTLESLNGLLFEQIDRINDDELEGEELDKVLKKAEAINRVAGTIVQAGNLQLRAYEQMGRHVGEQTGRLLGVKQ